MKQHTGFKRDCLIQVCSWCANDCSSLTFQFRNIMLHPQFPFAYYCFSKPAHTYLHENYYSAEIMIKSASTLLRREYFKHCKINHKALEPASSCVTFVSNCIFFLCWSSATSTDLIGYKNDSFICWGVKILRDGRFLAFVYNFAYRVWSCPNIQDKHISDIGLQAGCFEYIGYFFISGSPKTYTCH